ncbi:MAG: prepilin-type N-terminal cleavage/methylation domain-containing protein [Deltaproteobacteria bacterium]|nr:prepilin-type N-terminal cleavage/methylation domain-containing protein [Deltaproteobacteria bacterium]
MKHFLRARDPRGFTLIEIIATLVIIGIVVAVIINRVIGTSDTSRVAQESVIKNHIRYAQGMAMKRGGIWGIKCDGPDYWLFRTNAPDTPGNQIVLPGEDNAKVTLANKNVTMTASSGPTFTVSFDATGRPYTDAAINMPVSAGNPVTITVDSIPAGSGTPSFNVTPETGFIP